MKSVDLCDEKFEMFTHFSVDLCDCRVTNVDLHDENDIGLYRSFFVPKGKCRLMRNVELCDVELCEVERTLNFSNAKGLGAIN